MNLTREGYKVIMSESEFDLTVIHADEVTAVEVTFWGKETYRTTGAAKRHPDDADDAALGEKLAVSRALKKLSDELAKDARKEVAKADDKRRRAAAAEAQAASLKEIQELVDKVTRVESVSFEVTPVGANYGPSNPCPSLSCYLCRPRG